MIALRTDPTPGYVLRIYVGTQTRASVQCVITSRVSVRPAGIYDDGLFHKSEIRARRVQRNVGEATARSLDQLCALHVMITVRLLYIDRP